jgi:uncharacterized membrane protein
MWGWALSTATAAAVLAGMVLGYYHVEAAVLGFVAGILIWMARRIRLLEHELELTSHHLLERIRSLEKAVSSRQPTTSGAPTVPYEPPAPEVAEPEPETAVHRAPEPETPPAPPEPMDEPAPAAEPTPEVAEAGFVTPTPWSEPLEHAGARLWRWAVAFFTGENAVVRMGLGVTFVGLAFLYGYGLEQHWIGVEWNYILAAAGGLAGLLWGWRLRAVRRGYALLLQGGGVAVLYSAVFAATRLHGLLPEGLAFALMVVFVLLAVALAALQNAQGLAVAGALGGYFVPLLLFAGGRGNDHVFLFAFYAVLNVGGVGLLLLRSWPTPLLVGFAFSTATALFWGLERYQPEDFWSAQLFLLVYFVTFVSAAVVHALHSKQKEPHGGDLFLLFVTPLVGFSLQAALVRPYLLGPALSALAVAAYYAVVARWLWRGRARFISEAALTLAIGFLTLAVPLATDLRTTVLAWAVEGAGLVWLGLRYRGWLPLSAGLVLLAAVNLAFFFKLTGGIPGLARGHDPLTWLGYLLLALNMAFVNWILHTHAEILPEALRGARPAAALLALFWWLVAGAQGILDNELPLETRHAWLVWTAASLGLAPELGRHYGWRELVRAFFALPLLLLPAALAELASSGPLLGVGLLLWIPVLALWFRELHRADGWLRHLRPWGAALGFFYALALVTLRIHAQVETWVGGYADWPLFTLVWVPLAAFLIFSAPALVRRWSGLSILQPLAIPLTAGGLAVWWAASSLFSAGDPSPLRYLPVLNPLELTQLLTLAALALWALRTLGPRLAHPRRTVATALGGLLFFWANTVIGRTVHYLGGVPFDWSALFATQWFHTALSIFWGVTVLVLMVLGSRLGTRNLWQMGLGLYGLTVVKLFLVDLSERATVARIISFLGVGLLLVVTGYFAPRPAAPETEAS